MATIEEHTTGAPCWIELFASDPDLVLPFYGELFGWQAEPPREEFGGYINVSTADGRRLAGCMKNDGSAGAPDGWSIYLRTENAEQLAEDTVSNGGAVMVPTMEVMDLGTMAVVADAGQAAIGAWQPGTHRGFQAHSEPGAPVWFELHTRDYDASVAFYRDVFGWDTHVEGDTPEFRYTTLGEGDDSKAGIMDASAFLPEGVPAHWSIYFQVDDADDALAKVTELGGSVVMAADDTPYGRLATAADPGGNTFKLMQPN